MLSQSCKYGIWAILYLASVSDRKYVAIREISSNLKISFHFLTKILQSLTQANIIVSMRGASGGVALARPADTIHLREIIEAVDGSDIFTECILGLPGCDNDQHCPLHTKWAAKREAFTEMCESTTLDMMVDDAESSIWLNSEFY